MVLQLGCDVLVGYSKCVFDPNFCIVDVLLGVCILVCVVSQCFAQRVDFSLHGRDGVGGSDELILHMSERSDGGSLGEGGWGATTPGVETERGSVARWRHGVSLWLIIASRHHGAGSGPHTEARCPARRMLVNARE